MWLRHFGAFANLCGACVIPLPSAGQIDVTIGSLQADQRTRVTLIRNFVPHQAAGVFGIDWFGDDEGGDVTDFAIGVFRQIQVVDDPVHARLRVKDPKGPAGDLFSGDPTRQ